MQLTEKRAMKQSSPVSFLAAKCTSQGFGAISQAGIIRALTRRAKNMNRRKKITQLLKAHAKKASAKLAPASKSKYISKADRLKLAAETSQDSDNSSES